MYLAMLGDADIPWAVAVLGGSVADTPIARAAIERGGHVRVGIEDWDDGPANAEQVSEVAELARTAGAARGRRRRGEHAPPPPSVGVASRGPENTLGIGSRVAYAAPFGPIARRSAAKTTSGWQGASE